MKSSELLLVLRSLAFMVAGSLPGASFSDVLGSFTIEGTQWVPPSSTAGFFLRYAGARGSKRAATCRYRRSA
jgi:hypothetical protein